MARVFLDLPKIRLEMAWLRNDSGGYQLQCAILAVLQVGVARNSGRAKQSRPERCLAECQSCDISVLAHIPSHAGCFQSSFHETCTL